MVKRVNGGWVWRCKCFSFEVTKIWNQDWKGCNNKTCTVRLANSHHTHMQTHLFESLIMNCNKGQTEEIQRL